MGLYPITQDFSNKIREFNRKVYGKVQIDYTDPFLDQSIQMNSNENANISYPAQTADSVQEPIGKIASLDGSWVLDGSYILAPSPDDADTMQMGWWGKQLAQADGTFIEPYPTLTATFFSRPIHSLKVVGDSARGEYPVDFNIKLYDSQDTVLYTETVTGNMEVIWDKALENPITQVTKMDLTITKWSHPGRQVKILEFFTSIQEIYEGDDILLINLLEEREVSQDSLPVGNISANEIDIKLNNETRKFDAGNTQSPLYQTLKANRRIKAWLGVQLDDGTKEWIPLGTFWSGDWSAPEDSLYAQTTGRDRLELLRKSIYSTSTVQQNKTLYDLAIDVLQDAGLTTEEYWVDTELQQYLVPYSYFEPQSHREALRKIAEACLGQVYCDRDGILRIEGPSYLESKTTADLSITQDDYFKKDNPVRWGQIANYIEVETQPLRPDVIKEVYRSNELVNITAGQTLTITAYYNETPCIDAVATLEGAPEGCTIQEATYYAWGADIKIYSPNAGTFTVVINAKPLKVLNKEKAIAKDDNSITDNGLLKYTFPTNPLIQTLSIAQDIANKLLQYYKNPRRDVSLEWRGNPALLLGDRVSITDKNETNDYYVVRQEIEYSGALRARIEGRRA